MKRLLVNPEGWPCTLDEADEYYERANVFFKKEDPACEHVCGYGPSLRDVASLWAIQKKFSETYSKLLQTKKETL